MAFDEVGERTWVRAFCPPYSLRSVFGSLLFSRQKDIGSRGLAVGGMKYIDRGRFILYIIRCG
jgi:hypothetical protein